jgi:acetate---CoA ligase (ADP-forming)
MDKTLETLFSPESIAVVGASRDPASIGNKIVCYLHENGFRGQLYPINPSAKEIAGLMAYPSTSAIGKNIDLAIVSVPAPKVLTVIEDCHRASVKVVVVISAGFAEAGVSGKEMELELVRKVREYGMRMVGPNCFGVINTDPAHPLNASFSPAFPPAGSVAMASQSGALGIAALDFALDYHLGLSKFVSLGNKAELSSNDLLEYWENDDKTQVILLYLESFGNPTRFSEIARRITAKKPIIALKSGRSVSGNRAAGSHTAALAASDVAVEALFHQSCVLRAETMEEMFQLALAFSSQPLPRGDRVGIITNAGGPAILCTDACEAGGLKVSEFSIDLQKKLTEMLPHAASLRNPVDLIAGATSADFRSAIALTLSSDEIDSLVLIFTVIDAEAPSDLLTQICQGIEEGRKLGGVFKPVLFCLMERDRDRPPVTIKSERLPLYRFPEEPGRLLAQMRHYAKLMAKRGPTEREMFSLPSEKQTIVRKVLSGQLESQWLSPAAVREILQAGGLCLPDNRIATTAAGAVLSAKEIGLPVALKLISQKFTHKTEVGGVRLNLSEPTDIAKAFEEMKEKVVSLSSPDAFQGVLIQPMVVGGTEIFIGMNRDPLFGPLIGFGLGGIYVEILSDVRFRVAPLTRQDAREMIQEIRGFKVLQGYRGRPAADVDALVDCLLRISALSMANPEIRSLDLNPVIALPPGSGYRIVDARIEVKT